MIKIMELYDCDRPKTSIIFSKEELTKALQDFTVKERIKNKCWYGEIGGPINSDIYRTLIIDSDYIGFKILDFWWEENKLMGNIDFNEEALKRFNININELSQYRLVPRGLGKRTKNGIDDLILVCFDLKIGRWIKYEW